MKRSLEAAGFGLLAAGAVLARRYRRPFEDITVPTLGVHAVDDPLASYEDARSMVARVPGSHWVAVERGGHIFIHSDEHALADLVYGTNGPCESRTRGGRPAEPRRMRAQTPWRT